MFGVTMYASKVLMEAIPNVHLLGMFTMLLTVVYRSRALYPIYAYVLLNGLMAGFSPWWLPYLYVWTVLWGVTMLLPRRMPDKVAAVVYPLVCAAHGLAFGTLYAPAQALMFGEGELILLKPQGFDLVLFQQLTEPAGVIPLGVYLQHLQLSDALAGSLNIPEIGKKISRLPAQQHRPRTG